jgi:hypothetical protein
MKASRFSDAQKAFILKQGADGMPVADFAARPGSVRRLTSQSNNSRGSNRHWMKVQWQLTSAQPSYPISKQPELWCVST